MIDKHDHPAGSDNIDDLAVPMRIGQLGCFFHINGKFIGYTTGQIFDAQWKGLEAPIFCKDDAILGKKVYEIQVLKRINADVTTDRGMVKPTGRVIGRYNVVSVFSVAPVLEIGDEIDA